MDSSHKLKIALIKIRLVADISREAQCKAGELQMIMERVSELADRVLEDEQENTARQNVISDDEINTSTTRHQHLKLCMQCACFCMIPKGSKNA